MQNFSFIAPWLQHAIFQYLLNLLCAAYSVQLQFFMLIKVFPGLASKVDQICQISRSHVSKILSYAHKTFFVYYEETLALSHLSSSDAKALSLVLIHSFKPFSSLGGDSPPDAVPPPPLLVPRNNTSTSTPIAILIAVSMEAIVMPCSLNRVQIFSPNEVSLSNTLAIASLKLVIWFFSLPSRRSIDSCLVASPSLSLLILFSTSS